MKILKTIAIVLLFTTTACAQTNETKLKEPDYSNVDYSARSNIIKRPNELKGDEKAIFYHPFFLNLTHEEAKNLEPLKVKEEFAKLGITLKEDERFGKAFSFYDAVIMYHKKSCEQWENFKDLAPKSQN